jgi:hypothetical protein
MVPVISLGTPQRNLIHSTLPQNQCAQHSAGRDALASTMEQPTGNQTPATGTDGYTPHRDEGTQMPSQEIRITTVNQSTQIPSQQRDLTITAEDLEPKQSKAITPATTSQNTSPRSGAHQGTYTSQPTHPPTPETEVSSTVESCQKIYIHSKPVVIQKNQTPIQIMDTMTKKDSRDQYKGGDTTAPPRCQSTNH